MSRHRRPNALLFGAVGAALAFGAVGCSATGETTTVTEATVLSIDDVIGEGAVVDEDLLEEFFDDDAVLEELIGFIEISVRIGDGEESALFALAVDASTLAEAALAGPNEAAAWCTGSLLESGEIPREYLVRVEPDAISITAGEIERFELRVDVIDIGIDHDGTGIERSASGTVAIEIDSTNYEITDAAIGFGESWNSAVFEGSSSTGVTVEGALLCG